MRRRNYLVKKFSEVFSIRKPDGTFYAFPDISSTGLSSMEFTEKLLIDEKVAVVPGNAFGECGEGYIRIAFAIKFDLLREAVERIIDFAKFGEIANEVGAVHMADIAHIAGLVACGLHPSPVPHAQFVTTTTHKTLRGPRGGVVMCKEEYAKSLDRIVFPGGQGGPLMHIIAAKAVAFKEALMPEFKAYQRQIIANAQTLASELKMRGFRLVSGGTDNHLMLVDLRNKGLTGKEAEEALDRAGITVNKNTIPFDPQKPFIASGIRIGTPALTTRGMKEEEMKAIAEFINDALEHRSDEAYLGDIRQNVRKLCEKFPLYPELLKVNA